MPVNEEIRIPTTETQEVNDLLFGERRWNGPRIAEAIQEKHMTLWSWFNRRGLPVSVALRLATEMDRRATDLIRAAGTLRRLAQAARARQAEAADENAQAPV